MGNKQIKYGAIISYILIVINLAYGLLYTPYVLSKIGKVEYGVYQTIGSFSASLLILDVGLGSTVLRYISKFTAIKDKKSTENYIAMALIQAFAIIIIILLASFCIFPLISNIHTLQNEGQVIKAQELFILFVISATLTVFENVLFGTICGHNRFIFANSLKLLRIVLKVLFVYLVLKVYRNSVWLIAADIIMLVGAILFEYLYIKFKLNLKIKLYKWDKPLFIESFKYTAYVLVYTIANMFNGSIDKIVINIKISSALVTIYSIGLQLHLQYEHFATAITDMMMPTVSKIMAKEHTTTDLEDVVIRTGRFQFMLLSAVMCGFIVLGKDFIALWLGNSYAAAYYVALILIVPATIPLIESVCLTIIRVKNKIAFRTAATCVMAAFNLLFTYVGVSIYKNRPNLAICVAAGATALGYVLINGVAMNIYYYKVINLNIFRIFKGVFNRILVCNILAVAVLLLCRTAFHFSLSWISLIIQIAIFCTVYGPALFLWGMNKEEKKSLLSMIKYKRLVAEEDV